MTINNKEYIQWKKTSKRKKIIFGTCLAVAGIGVGTGIGIALGLKKSSITTYVKSFTSYDELVGYWNHNSYVGTHDHATFDYNPSTDGQDSSAGWDYAKWINNRMSCELLMRMISYNINEMAEPIPNLSMYLRTLQHATIQITEQDNYLQHEQGKIYGINMFADGVFWTDITDTIDWRIEFATIGSLKAHYAHESDVVHPDCQWFDIAQPGFVGNEDKDNLLAFVFMNLYYPDSGETQRTTEKLTAEMIDLELPDQFVPNVKVIPNTTH